MSEEIRDLVSDGEVLLDEAGHLKGKVSDYSFLVFPFSKAYEGFLKKLFLDLDLLKEDEYYGDDIRIGRILNPSYIHELSSIYKKVCFVGNGVNNDVSEKLWQAWRKGRNQVFHYFPHNFRKLSYDEALEIIHMLADAMTESIDKCKVTLA